MVAVDGDYSVLHYTPKSSRDYGTLSCWVINPVGTQAEPCRFTVVEAGRFCHEMSKLCKNIIFSIFHNDFYMFFIRSSGKCS